MKPAMTGDDLHRCVIGRKSQLEVPDCYAPSILSRCKSQSSSFLCPVISDAKLVVYLCMSNRQVYSQAPAKRITSKRTDSLRKVPGLQPVWLFTPESITLLDLCPKRNLQMALQRLFAKGWLDCTAFLQHKRTRQCCCLKGWHRLQLRKLW